MVSVDVAGESSAVGSIETAIEATRRAEVVAWGQNESRRGSKSRRAARKLKRWVIARAISVKNGNVPRQCCLRWAYCTLCRVFSACTMF